MRVQNLRDALKDTEVRSLFADIIDQKVDVQLAKLHNELPTELAKKFDELSVTISNLRSEGNEKNSK